LADTSRERTPLKVFCDIQVKERLVDPLTDEMWFFKYLLFYREPNSPSLGLYNSLKTEYSPSLKLLRCNAIEWPNTRSVSNLYRIHEVEILIPEDCPDTKVLLEIATWYRWRVRRCDEITFRRYRSSRAKHRNEQCYDMAVGTLTTDLFELPERNNETRIL